MGALLTSLAACSHGPTIQEYPATADPQEEVTRLDGDITEALHGQMDVLSPSHMKEARDALEDARKGLSNQDDPKDILHNVAKGRAHLGSANEFTQVAHQNIEDVALARKAALKAGAESFYTADFKDTDDKLKSVTSGIENNNLAAAVKKRTELQDAYLALELRAIQESQLGTAKQRIKQAKDEGAKTYAPRSLAMAEKSVADSEAFITANRHSSDAVEARARKTLADADHALKITRDSKSGKKVPSEEMALKLEREQNEVQTKRSQLNAEQGVSKALAESNAALSKSNSTLDNNNSALLADKEFARKFEAARAQFSPSEAEVYRQGNTLTIRLRGLQFPTAKAVLRQDNFALLAKVHKVIRDFGNSSVIIEGHTDSIGGKAVNESLSSKRAEAVREYLVTNAEAGQLNISAVGYDYQKPLATNKTASGRAQNRRVDVLIKADHADDESSASM